MISNQGTRVRSEATMKIKPARLVWPAILLLPALLAGSCKSQQSYVSEIFHFESHLEDVDATGRIELDSKCETDANGNKVVTETNQIDKAATIAILRSNDPRIRDCATRWVARFDDTTRAVSNVEITSGDRSPTSNMMTATVKLGGMSNSGSDRFEIPNVGHLTAISLVVQGPVKSAGGAAVPVSCTAEFSFQENATSVPRPVFASQSNDFCEATFTLFDDTGHTAGGQFKVLARNTENTGDRRVLIIPDGAFSLSLE